jgi:hypothetical protein
MSGPEPTQAAPISVYSPEFEALWRIYPRRVAKGAAYKAFRSALKRASFETIWAAMEKQLKELAMRNKTYVPHLSTWLNHDRWLDEADPTPEQKAAQSDLTQFIVSRVQAYRRLVAADPSKAERYFAQQPPVVRDAIERAH